MSDWPTTEIDAVQHLRAVAGGIRSATVTERVVDAPVDEVWRLLSDLEGSFGRIQPDMQTVTVLERRGDRIHAHAKSRYGMRADLHGVLRPGFCWLQSRFLIIGMAVASDPGGQTRVALTGGVRLPRRAGLLPVGVRREARQALDRLETILVAGP